MFTYLALLDVSLFPSHQANKGIYLDRTAAKGAVERAHLIHTLAHGLANRPELSELCHTGIYLDVSQPRALHAPPPSDTPWMSRR